MNMPDAIRSSFARWFDFDHRSTRAEFWWWALFSILALAAASLADTALLGGAFQPITLIVGLALFMPGLAVSVRRLHDTGRSGWWLLVAFVPIIGWLTLIYWYVKPSEQRRNQYDDVMSIV